MQVKAGTVSVGSGVVCKVDYERRANVAPNHTMTHVLNFALRKVTFTLILVLHAICVPCSFVAQITTGMKITHVLTLLSRMLRPITLLVSVIICCVVCLEHALT